MTDTLLPIIRQMHDEADDASRADILLRVPDAVLLKFAKLFEDACRKAGFKAGATFILLRLAALRAVRDAGGKLPADTVAHLDSYRTALAVLAAGKVGS